MNCSFDLGKVRSNMSKPEVELYTDGACSGNPGPGGWAYLLRHKNSGEVEEKFGTELEATNNRMELTAVIQGLQSLAQPSTVELYSDSVYVVKGLNEWLDNWLQKNWRTSARKPVKNADLWRILDELRKVHELHVNWVRGHDNHPENERCDFLATSAIDHLRW